MEAYIKCELIGGVYSRHLTCLLLQSILIVLLLMLTVSMYSMLSTTNNHILLLLVTDPMDGLLLLPSWTW